MIVEDDLMLLQNLKFLLDGEKDIDVVSACPASEDALEELTRVVPDILLVDLELPGMSGIDFIRKAKKDFPDVEIMVYTVIEDRDKVFSAIKSGATGYILKSSSPRELVDSLHTLYHGGVPMSHRVARLVIKEFQTSTERDEYVLSPREKDILYSIEKGFSYKEIASIYNISIHTVHTHIKNIYEKLHAKDRRDALLKARRKGII